MCGFAGAFSPDPSLPLRPVVDAIVDAQACRGPDHREVSAMAAGGGQLVFGHNRLSIIDLSAEANQPMWDHEHRFCIVFNGEIYNYLELRGDLHALGHTFTTESDTEVILEAFKAWGTDALNRLNGMFAFAIAEPAAGRLWLVRDRFGVKPLYYHHAGGALYFSSTPGELARQLSLPPNLAYVSRGLHYWLYEDDGPISQYEGVNAVPSGQFIAVRDCGDGRPEIAPQRYYDLEARVEARRENLAGVTDDEAAEQVLSLLQDAVRLRLRADVPVGISLSGGLDSSSIAALVSEMHADVRGFSYGRPDVPGSEGPLVAHVARMSGITPNYIWPSPDDGIAAFWQTLEAQDAPFPGLSIVAQYLVFQAAHAQGMKVLLGGQGADEVLMGYRKFQVMLLVDALRRRDARAALRFGLSAGLMLVAEARTASVYLRQRQRYLSPRGLSTQLRLPPPAELDLAYDASEPVWRRQVRDVKRLSLPTLLRYEDRNSMGNSLETRLPFLDYRFVELALALPDRLRVRAGYGKWVLRQAVIGRVPPPIRTARYKRGFDAPQLAWIRSGLGQSIRRRLSDAPNAASFTNGQSVDELFNNQRLAADPTAIAEATSLLWLSSK
jgi:asparagine synthase (glutamine-hydrolysing)